MTTSTAARLVSGAVVLVGLWVGYAAGSAPHPGVAAQQEVDAYPAPPTWETAMPAARISRADRTLWPHQPTTATHWSIDDITRAHARLAEAERSGEVLDPNDALHDFPYWTRTHSLFIRHASRRDTGATAEQHLGYAQFLVIMGGTGEVRAGGRLDDAETLVEDGRPIYGEQRGSGIVGGERFAVGPGDWVSIPADTPTQVATSAEGGLTYLVMKINAMLYPWELIR